MSRQVAICVLLLLPALVDCTVSSAQAQELRGAKRLIEEIFEKADKLAKDERQSEWEFDLQALSEKLKQMPPTEAASAWLKIVERWSSEGKPNGFSAVIGAVPAPGTWAEIRTQIGDSDEEDRFDGQEFVRRLCLRALAERLAGDLESVHKTLLEADGIAREHLKRAEEENPDGVDEDDIRWAKETRDKVRELEDAIHPLWKVERLKREIAEAPGKEVIEVKVPELMELIGREEATKLLEQAFSKDRIALTLPTGMHFNAPGPTLALAIEVAKKQMDRFKHPVWTLCHSLDSIELFERFQTLPKSESEWRFDKDEAESWYVFALIAKGRDQDAFEFVNTKAAMSSQVSHDLFGMRNDIDWHGFSVMSGVKKVPEFLTFLLRLKEARPELDFRGAIFRCALEVGGQAKVEELIAKKVLPDGEKQDLAERRADDLLEAGRVDEGVVELLAIVRLGRESQEKEGRIRGNEPIIAERIAKIGLLFDHPEWTQQALADIASFSEGGVYEANDVLRRTMIYRKAKQFDKAEQMLLESLARLVAAQRRAQSGGPYAHLENHSNLPFVLRDLAVTYFAAGRFADVVTLLEEAPWWSASDLAQEIASVSVSHSPYREDEPIEFLPEIAARSLAKVGRAAEARKIAEALTQQYAGHDPTWELLLEIAGDDFERIAIDAIARDRFEERPSIWLAKFFLKKGDLDKAEALVRKAIEIDPSDGDQPHGARLLAYGVLSQICRAKGDETNAEIYAGAVKAIRLAEKADKFLALGLRKQGLETYQASLLLFADAYCIQSRLAIQLEQSGDLKAAEKHYERAFELMPQSFGNLEVDCTGCASVFSSELGQNTSERVFKRLLEADPKNPRLYYLMGRAKMSAGEDAEAIRLLKEAVRLDPDYLSAWILLDDNYYLTSSESESAIRQEAAFALLRLDPRSRHSHVNLENIRDLARFWRVTHDPSHESQALTAPIFRLKAVPYDPQRANSESKFQSWRDHRFEWHPQLSLFAEWMRMGEEEER